MSLIFCLLFFIYSQEEILDEGSYSEDTLINESSTSELNTEDNSEPTKDFDTSTIEGRIAKYYYDREPINDKDWKSKIGSSFDEVYIIVVGDTLWSISEKFLDSPTYWPKIWSLNPYITNPHLIYPGNEIKFKFYSEDAPELSIGEPDYDEDTILQYKNQTDYSSLELEVRPYKFDKLGFLMSSSSLKTSKPETISYKNPFEFYLKNNLKILGELKIIDAEKNIYAGDFVLIEKNSKFTCKNSYSLVNKKGSAYVLAGELIVTDENSCKSKISKLYDIVDSKTFVTDLIQINEITSSSNTTFKGSPKSLDKDLYSEGDNIFVEFDRAMPNIGEPVFFYENNNLIGIGKVLFNDKDVSTVVILASNKPITKNVKVSSKN